jgi:hypothetical protein
MLVAVVSTAATWCVDAAVASADPVPPTNSVSPSIARMPQQGDQLTANPGTWSGDRLLRNG